MLAQNMLHLEHACAICLFVFIAILSQPVDCAATVTPVTSGQVVTGTITVPGPPLFLPTSRTFSFNVTSTTNMQMFVFLNQTAAKNVAFLGKANSAPTLTSFDFQDSVSTTSQHLVVLAPPRLQIANYFFLVQCQALPCSFAFSVTLSPGCPYNCSDNGVCLSNKTCQCNAQFSGNACQTFNGDLTQQPITFYTGGGYQNVFPLFIDTAITNILVVSLNQTSVTGNTQVYLYTSPPPGAYMALGVGTPTYKQIPAVKTPQLLSQTYYVGVQSDAAATFIVTALAYSGCPNECTEHGYCNASTTICTCNAPYQGTDCGHYMASITNGQVLSGYVPTGGYTRYFIDLDVKTQNWLYVNVQTLSRRGSADLFLQVGTGSEVSLTSYLLSNQSGLVNSSLTFSVSQATHVQLAVYGFAATKYQMTVQTKWVLNGWPLYALIAGVVVVVAILAIVVLVCVLRRQKNRSSAEEKQVPNKSTISQGLLQSQV